MANLYGPTGNFFTALRSKVEIEVDRNFDQRFWAAFDQENSRAHSKVRASSIEIFAQFFRSLLQPARLAPLALALVAALGIYRYEKVSRQARLTSTSVARREPVQNAQNIQDRDFFENTDLFLSFDDVTSITDDEWENLLENT